jgi:N-acetylmuramoyl-L-alanine amidase
MGWRSGAGVIARRPTLFRAVLCSLAGAAAVIHASAEELPIATDVRVGGDDTQTRLVVDLSSKIDIRPFTLADPYRVVLDMPEVSFRFPRGTGETGRGLIKAFRYGRVVPGGSRMVIDLAQPARIDKAFVTKAVGDQPARLILDLSATDRVAFMRTIAGRPPQRSIDHPRADPRPLIVLDPGHGGHDSGATAPTGEAEKTIVLEFAHVLRQKLEATGKYRVVMTRTDDRFIPLWERPKLARSQQASLFISIHNDWSETRSAEARGATVYTLSETASDPDAAQLTERENRAIVIAGLDLSAEPADIAGLLIDLAKRETKVFSLQMAQTLIGELRATTTINPTPLRSGKLIVLKAPDVPSVLIELGFLTNRGDLEHLLSDTWRSTTADSIARAVAKFFTARLTSAKSD